MLKRKIYNQLLEWKELRKNKSHKESLMVLGARQVGKTSIIESFGKNEYKSFININFITNSEYKEIFKGSKNPDDILLRLSIYFPDFTLIPGETLIFLDEIQNCGDARTSIKFLSSDFRFDVISSGSLLGLEYGENGDVNVDVPESIPVGFEQHITMYSLDFEEFLWARGYKEDQINILKSFFDKIERVPDAINLKFEELFREYMIVGGMPEVVNTYIQTMDMNQVFRVQDKIISNYHLDISKHAKGEEKVRVRACYDSVPKQLAKEYKKFQYSQVEKGKTSRKYGGSVKWLKDSSLVNVCYNTFEPMIPLVAYEKEDQFKLYFNDTGLLTELYGRQMKLAILNDSIQGNASGAVYENIISECLIKRGYTLHFFKPNEHQEIEFIIEKDGFVVPIEVKASNSATASLNAFLEKYKPKYSYKLIKGNIGKIENKITIPHYMVMFL